MSTPARRPRSGPGSDGGAGGDGGGLGEGEISLREEPTAPTAEEWAALGPAQQERVMDDLVGYEEERASSDLSPPEGEEHLNAKVEARDTLRAYFRTQRPSLFVSADIPVYYAGQRAIRPDLIAVEDVPTHARDCWMVSKEGKGIDLALEIHNKGSWRKDFTDNVARYAELGIREYFIFHLRKGTLQGYRLRPDGGEYVQIPPSGDRLYSEVLRLDLLVDEERRLRFYQGTAELLGGERLLTKVRTVYEAALRRAEAEAKAAEAAASTAEAAASTAETRARASVTAAILQLCEVFGVEPSEARQALLDEEDSEGLDRLLRELARLRRWPD